MATPQSPTRFNGLIDDDLYSDMNFTADISHKMRVPKRIKATGEYSDDDHLLLSNQNGIMNSWNYSDKIDMNVPDRIVVIGQDQHLGTRSAPREIVLENSILPKDPGFVRVATPPRIITLNQHNFPSATDDELTQEQSNQDYVNDENAYLIKANTRPNSIGFNPDDINNSALDASLSERHLITATAAGAGGTSRKVLNYGFSGGDNSYRDSTPPLTENMTPTEEVLHLRRQLNKLNRRVHCIELENLHRQQREKIIYCLGLTYFLLKAIFWLNKN